MNSETTREITLNLTLHEREIRMLKDWIQNPIRDNEPQYESDFRRELFETLQKALVG